MEQSAGVRRRNPGTVLHYEWVTGWGGGSGVREGGPDWVRAARGGRGGRNQKWSKVPGLDAATPELCSTTRG